MALWITRCDVWCNCVITFVVVNVSVVDHRIGQKYFKMADKNVFLRPVIPKYTLFMFVFFFWISNIVFVPFYWIFIYLIFLSIELTTLLFSLWFFLNIHASFKKTLRRNISIFFGSKQVFKFILLVINLFIYLDKLLPHDNSERLHLHPFRLLFFLIFFFCYFLNDSRQPVNLL